MASATQGTQHRVVVGDGEVTVFEGGVMIDVTRYHQQHVYLNFAEFETLVAFVAAHRPASTAEGR